jgi:hypothetical protein
MRRFLICVATFLVSCGPQEHTALAGDTSTSDAALSQFAGTWHMREFNEAGDSIGWFELVATADTSGWKTIVPDRAPIARRVVAAGADSVVNEIGPFESVLRPGVFVRTREVFHLVDANKLVGTIVAHYMVSGPDSVLRIRTEGTRVDG